MTSDVIALIFLASVMVLGAVVLAFQLQSWLLIGFAAFLFLIIGVDW